MAGINESNPIGEMDTSGQVIDTKNVSLTKKCCKPEETEAHNQEKTFNSDLEEKNWRSLINSIRLGNCILMLGPDAATEEVDGQHRPLTEILAEELAKEISPENRKQINRNDLAQVSQCYRLEKNLGIEHLEMNVSAFYKKRDSLTSKLHENLAALPFYFVVTTTPDKMLYNAYIDAKKTPNVEVYNFKEASPDIIEKTGSVEQPLLYYLYGSVNNPTSLMLSESDLLDFLENLIKTKPIPANIRSELQGRTKNLLFLGFGFRHWYLRLLLHILRGRNKERSSIAMEASTHGSPRDYAQTIFFFKNSDYKVHIFNNELGDFVEKLNNKYKELLSMKPKKPETEIGPEEKPVVFICHVDEDKDKAKFFETKLQKAGLDTWLDKSKLKSGEKWENTIQKAIKKEVDYFLVLQSSTLAKKTESYAFGEISLALERQAKFRTGFPFILPVKIDECQLLEELDGLQTEELILKPSGNPETIQFTAPNKFMAFTRRIKRDFQRREQ